MRFNKLDLNLLVALDSLLNLRSVSRAADGLNMTQPAMSNALARLRTYFGDDLLVRIGRQLVLTPRAESLKDAVRDLLVRVEWTIATSSPFDPARSGREFNILVSDYTLVTLVPNLLATARRQSANVRFNFLQQVSPPEKSLDRGDIDLLIIPKEFCSPQHPTELVLDEEFCCIVWKDGKFAKRKLSKDDYRNASHIVMQPPGSALSLEAVFLSRHSVERRIEVMTFNFTSIPHLVVGTDYIATVHARLARQAQRALPIKIVAPPFALPKMQQTLQWHRYRSQDAGLIWLRGLIREVAKASSLPKRALGSK